MICKASLSKTVLHITQLIKDISQLELSITDLEKELELLVQRGRRIEKWHANDIEAFALRQKRDTKALAALNKLIPKLYELLDGAETYSYLLWCSQEDISKILAKIPRGKSLEVTMINYLSFKIYINIHVWFFSPLKCNLDLKLFYKTFAQLSTQFNRAKLRESYTQA